MASLFALLVVASVLAGTSGCMIEEIAANAEASVKLSQQILDLVKPMDTKVDRIEAKLMDIDYRTRLIATVQLIDQSKYEISDVYQDRLYIASKQEVSFDLQREDAKCVAQGGYLLEIDDDAEKQFTLDFAKKVGGSAHFATGGNDLDKEGTFVYYHSKKPVPSKVTWLPGEPNNYGGNEGCMVFRMSHDGLNDTRCNQNVKVLCEIPLHA